MVDTLDSKLTQADNIVQTPRTIAVEIGTQTKSQEKDINAIEKIRKAWDEGKEQDDGADSSRMPLKDQKKNEEFSVDYYDKDHGLMQREADDDLHNQILNELILANDMAHKNRINQESID